MTEDARMSLLSALKAELVGPCVPEEAVALDISHPVSFEKREDAWGPFFDAATGQELLLHDNPYKRYGVGVLYPFGVESVESVEANAEVGSSVPIDPDSDYAAVSQEEGRVDLEPPFGPLDDFEEDFDLSAANGMNPSSMGVSFLAALQTDSIVRVSFSCGRYEPLQVSVPPKGEQDTDGFAPEVLVSQQVEGETAESRERTWWVRRPVVASAMFRGEEILGQPPSAISPRASRRYNPGALRMRIGLFARDYGENRSLITAYVVNETEDGGPKPSRCAFQSRLRVTVSTPGRPGSIEPYPGPDPETLDEEEQSLSLLHSRSHTFAIGHGCAAGWKQAENALPLARSVSGESLPVVEVPSVSADDILREDRTRISISMANLAGVNPQDDGLASLHELAALYKSWIRTQEREAEKYADEMHKRVATRHLKRCKNVLDRIVDGIDFLESDLDALKAFRLANRAVLLQQLRGRPEARAIVDVDAMEPEGRFAERYEPVDLKKQVPKKGNWRPFQIAFLLMNLRAMAQPDSDSRKTVELIWFPTGGGKTEAYLGLIAYTCFIRRIKKRSDAGVVALMRYTLRLLTAQQFQRAARLICAMEYLRSQDERRRFLGDKPFSIGIWVGGDVTPNNGAKARKAVKDLAKGYSKGPSLLVSSCPWCGAQLGAVELPEEEGQNKKGKRPKKRYRVFGYEDRDDSVGYRCTDSSCHFSTHWLPIYVVDTDIYRHQPELVIGTVDKFAMLAWRSEVRRLFGIDASGNRTCPPPDLIIQDELHLISGPLGSMVGLYEPVIEALCTASHAPKIVCSTATIRNSDEQILSLFGRSSTCLFPPPGLEAGETFFGTQRDVEKGELFPGTVYVGVHAPGLGSIQTAQVRVYAALLQAPLALPENERDPWWTLMLFFNSLRELGYGITLFQSDIRDYLAEYCRRNGIPFDNLRRLWHVEELTSRIAHDEVPAVLARLAVPLESAAPTVDACLASNIIEVGIDVDRLSLMSVLGQPKTTAQYIQVTGRVGRDWKHRPGLVVTIYGPSKPRDRSHFEKFRTYHERLYSQVEPTSVTPFSTPALERALHGAMVAYVRQTGSQEGRPWPVPEAAAAAGGEILRARARLVDAGQVDRLDEMLDEKMGQWRRWKREVWDAYSDLTRRPLLTPPGSYLAYKHRGRSWQTPQNMRSVDAECEAAVTELYSLEDEGGVGRG